MGRTITLSAEGGAVPSALATGLASAGFVAGPGAEACVYVLKGRGAAPERPDVGDLPLLVAVDGGPGAQARAWLLNPAAVTSVDVDAIVAALAELLPPEVPSVVSLVDGTIDLEARRVTRGADEARLTEMEVGLLRYLTARPDRIVPNAEVLEQVWGYRPGLKTRAAHNTVRRLRVKIEADPAEPRHLLTEHGVGFQWASAEPQVVVAPTVAPAVAASGLFGRVEDLRRLLDTQADGGPRLVTLVGPGGVGKTSLLKEAAPQLDGSVFVDAAAARTPDDLAGAVAASLGVEIGGGDPVIAVGHVLAERGTTRLLLDNLEQVRPSPAPAVAHWLSASSVRVIATSRNPLALPEEERLPLAPLPAAGDDARDLFLARVRAAAPAFEVDDSDALLEVLELLDGLPLAIELAAPRVRLLGLEQLRARLAGDLAALRTRRPEVVERHASLEAALRWSWELLDAEQRNALVALSVFEGPFQASEAIDVLGGDPLDAEELVEDLVDSSLLVSGDEPGWWRQLRSVQSFARSRDGMKAEFEEAAARHAASFGALGAPSRVVSLDRRAGRGFRAARRRIGEIEVAIDRCLDVEDADGAAALLSIACAVRTRVGPTAPLKRRLARLWSSADAASRCRAVAFLASPGLLATVGVSADDLDSAHRAAGPLEPSVESLVLAQRGHAEHGRSELAEAEALYGAVEGAVGAAVLCDRAAVARKSGDAAAAEAFLLEAGSWADRQDDRRMQASVLFGRALLLHGRGEVEHAVEAQRRGRDLARGLEDGRLQLVGESNLAILLQHLGRLDEAAEAFRGAVRSARELGNERSEAKANTNLGYVELARGDAEAARAAGGRAVAIADRLEIADTAARARLNLAVAWLDDDPARSLSLAQDAIGLIDAEDDPAADQFGLYVLGRSRLASGDGHGAAEAFLEAASAARAMASDAREAEALAWLGYAKEALGDAGGAQAAWSAAKVRAAEAGAGLGMDLRRLVDGLPAPQASRVSLH